MSETASEAVSNKKQLTDVSRDPSDYRATDHLYIRFHRRYGPTSETRTNPHITPDVIQQCIQQGRLSEARNGRVTFARVVDEIEWHLVASPDEQVVLTVYAPEYHDHALASVEVPSNE